MIWSAIDGPTKMSYLDCCVIRKSTIVAGEVLNKGVSFIYLFWIISKDMINGGSISCEFWMIDYGFVAAKSTGSYALNPLRYSFFFTILFYLVIYLLFWNKAICNKSTFPFILKNNLDGI